MATSEKEQGDPSVGGEQGHILPHSSDPWIERSPREKSIALKALIFFFSFVPDVEVYLLVGFVAAF